MSLNAKPSAVMLRVADHTSDLIARILIFTLLTCSLLGCPRGGASKKAPEPCKQLGQQCELEPGKLGACSYRSNCTSADCLYCQSQH